MPPDETDQPDQEHGRPTPSVKAAKGEEANPMALLGAGMELGGVIAVLTLLGWWLDGKWGTEPWLMLTGLSVAVVGGTYNVWRIAKRFFSDI